MAVEASQALKLKIPKTVYAWLEKESGKLDQPIDDLASVLIEEAMRVEQFQGIFFRNGGSGRRAVLVGTMDVWEMIMLYNEFGRDGILESYSVQEHQIDDALAYYQAFPEEIDASICENNQPVEYWMEKYPELNIQVHEW